MLTAEPAGGAPGVAAMAALPAGRCLNLPAIAAALRAVQCRFPEINRHLQSPRDRLDDVVIDNILTGYAYVDSAITAGVDFLAIGNVRHLLELNARVLCGIDPKNRQENRTHLRLTEEHFYDDAQGGIRDIVEWYQLHRDESPWRRAAGVYVRGLSQPQLFIEGNHRTGALIMSYLLAREGRPPFVLTIDNAKAYFDPSTVITRTKKTSLVMLYRLPAIKKTFAAFLKQQASPVFLLSGDPAVAPGTEPPPAARKAP